MRRLQPFSNEYTKPNISTLFQSCFQQSFHFDWHNFSFSNPFMKSSWRALEEAPGARLKLLEEQTHGVTPDSALIQSRLSQRGLPNWFTSLRLVCRIEQEVPTYWFTVISLSSHCWLEGKCMNHFMNWLTREKSGECWSKNRTTNPCCLLFFTMQQLIYSILAFWCEKTNNFAAN